jgi:proline iminopeptidase
VPVYLICGAQDRITNLDLQRQWLDQLQAPRKELIVFEMAAHLAFWEQPAHFEAALVTIVKEGAR